MLRLRIRYLLHQLLRQELLLPLQRQLRLLPRRKPAEVLKEVQADIKKIKIANHTIRQIYSLAGAKVDKDQIAYEVKNDRTGKVVAVFDFQKANPDSIELFFAKDPKDFEPGIGSLSVAKLKDGLNDRLNQTP